MTYARFIGIGSYLPEKVLTNKDLEKMMDTSDEWIRERTGIMRRHIAADNETTSSLGLEAAKRAMSDADIEPEDVDLIENTIERNLPGAFHIMKRAAGINYPTGPDKYQVTGVVTDQDTGLPIDGVEVIISQMDAGIFMITLAKYLSYKESSDLVNKITPS